MRFATTYLLSDTFNALGHSMPAVKGKPIPPDKTKSKEQKDLSGTDSPCLVSAEEKLENSSIRETKMPEANSTPASMKRKGSPLENAKNEKKRKDPSTTTDAICAAENEKTENLHGETKAGHSEPGMDAFPPKVVALHRVRWNMNKGSERWLAYGGAAGIVRCQEITLPTKVK
ncbi:hypothetical protein ACLOJK_021264 [Asimina triloba]